MPNASLLLRLFMLLAVPAVHAYAQTPRPPVQPTTGPAGSDYPYSAVTTYGPYYSSLNKAPYTEFMIYQPKGATLPGSFPVVMFLHGYFLGIEGYPAGDSPNNYIYWLQHLVKKGFTVVYPYYDYTLEPSEFTGSILRSWETALDLLRAGTGGLIPPTEDEFGIQTLFAGHSMGAVESFAVAQQLTLTPVEGVPPPRAIAAFTPGIGTASTLNLDFSGISPTISVVLVDGDDDAVDIPTALAIWSSIETVIPTDKRDFLEVISDSHGSPAQLGDHWFPDTNGVGDDDSGVDDRDYNVTWKLSVGLFNCTLYGRQCSYGLGHGSQEQINMGDWSDDTPVIPLRLQTQ
jgi:Chlorophyllase